MKRTCGCGKEYDNAKGGTVEKCAACYTRDRRGPPKRAPDPDRGKRKYPTQVWLTEEEFDRLTGHLPDKLERAEWIRQLIRAGFAKLDLRKRVQGG